MRRTLIAALSSVEVDIARFAAEHPEYAQGLQVKVIISARSVAKVPPEVLAELSDTRMTLSFPVQKPAAKKKPAARGDSFPVANGAAGQ